MADYDAADQVSLEKATMRAAVRAARRERLAAEVAGDREAQAAALADHGMAWLAEHERSLGHPVGCVTAYQEMAAEPPMALFVQALVDRDVQVLVPITLPDGVLRWRAAQSGRRDNPMTPQRGVGKDGSGVEVSSDRGSGGGDPDQLDGLSGSEALPHVDVAFIPALAVGPSGTRLGQGGGYYDRSIPALRASGRDVPVLAVVYPQEVAKEVPAHGHDITVDAALTPQGVDHLKRR